MTAVLFITSMLIFSTIGIFVSPLDAPLSLIAFFRAFFGTLTVFAVISFTGRKLDRKLLLKNAALLIISGVAIGANWVLLFEGYKLTGVAVATLCYYLAPAFVILVSPLVLREKVSVKKIICALVALLGMIPVSGVLNPEREVNLRGIAVSLCAALLYALVVILNKKIKNLSGLETTAVQLAVAAVTMGLYVFIKVPLPELLLDKKSCIILIVLGIVHTGIAYLFYFSSVKRIPATNAAILSYIDPAMALLLSYTVLKEDFNLAGFLGIVLIIASSVISEISFKKKEKDFKEF